MIDIYLNESKLIQFRKMTYVEFFPVKIEMSHVKSRFFFYLDSYACMTHERFIIRVGIDWFAVDLMV